MKSTAGVSGDRMLKSLALFMLGLPHADAGIFARASADTFYIFMPEEFHFYRVLHEEVSAYFGSYPLPLRVREKIGVCSMIYPAKPVHPPD